MPKKRHQGLEASIPNIIALERYKNVQFNMRSHFFGVCITDDLTKKFYRRTKWLKLLSHIHLQCCNWTGKKTWVKRLERMQTGIKIFLSFNQKQVILQSALREKLMYVYFVHSLFFVNTDSLGNTEPGLTAFRCCVNLYFRKVVWGSWTTGNQGLWNMNLKSQEGKIVCIVTRILSLIEGFGENPRNKVEGWGVEVGWEQSAFQITAFKTRFFVL